jgi:phage tail-like protein
VSIQIQQMAGQLFTAGGAGAAVRLSIKAQRVDRYKNFKFRVKLQGKYVAGFSAVGGLKQTTEVAQPGEAADPPSLRGSPERAKYEPITLERGVTYDASFDNWAASVGSSAAAGPAAEQRKDVILQIYNEAGSLVQSYNIYRCWVSEYRALPDLDAGGNAIAIEHIKLENEGWERDSSVSEPSEPTLSG